MRTEEVIPLTVIGGFTDLRCCSRRFGYNPLRSPPRASSEFGEPTMSLRHRVAFAFLCLAAWFACPALAQVGNPPQQSPVQQAAKALQDAQVVLKKAQADQQKARDKVKTQLKAKPEWATVTSDLAKAEADLKTAQRSAINAVHSKPEFVDLQKQKDDANKVRENAQKATPGSDDKVSDADLAAAQDTYIKSTLAMKAMEKKGLADDQAYNDAKARLEGFNAKMAELDAEVDESLKNDTDYQTLVQATATAQQAVDMAKDALAQARIAMAQQRQSSTPTRTPTPRSR